jgi:hypothetical protein
MTFVRPHPPGSSDAIHAQAEFGEADDAGE